MRPTFPPPRDLGSRPRIPRRLASCSGPTDVRFDWRAQWAYHAVGRSRRSAALRLRSRFWGWPSTGRCSPSTTSSTPTAPTGASRTSPRRASTPAASAPRRSRRRADRRVQHVDQRLRRHQGPGPDDAGAALQRRADARLRADLRRRRSLHDDAVGRPRRRRDLALGLHQHAARNWGRWLDTFTNTTERAADDQGRVRRPVGHRRDRRQLERDRQDLQRRRGGRRRRTRGSRSRRRSRARRWSAARRSR